MRRGSRGSGTGKYQRRFYSAAAIPLAPAHSGRGYVTLLSDRQPRTAGKSLFPLTIRAALIPRRDSPRTLMAIRPLPSPTVPFLPRRRPCRRRRCPRKIQLFLSLTLRATPRTIPRLHRYLRFNVASIRCASFLRTLAEEFAILPKHVSVVPLDYCCSRISLSSV